MTSHNANFVKYAHQALSNEFDLDTIEIEFDLQDYDFDPSECQHLVPTAILTKGELKVSIRPNTSFHQEFLSKIEIIMGYKPSYQPDHGYWLWQINVKADALMRTVQDRARSENWGQIKAANDTRFNGVFEALGWMHAECMSLQRRGVDLGTIDIAELVDRACLDLGLAKAEKHDGSENELCAQTPENCSHAWAMILMASRYLADNGRLPESMEIPLAAAEIVRQVSGGKQ